jgi:methionyl-tRNA formyltransferase
MSIKLPTSDFRLPTSLPYRILFLGTPDFAVPSLQAIAKDSRFEIVGVVTQPDKPVGRSAVMTPPPVKIAAQELGITTIKQPVKMTDPEFKTWAEEIGPSCDAFIVVAYGKIFRDWFLALPKHGLINVHASLLPRWRGASPINAVIAAGDSESGVSIMKIESEMDAGPIYRTAETPIQPNDTAETLHNRLSHMGADILANTVADIIEEKLQPISQDPNKATFCKTLTREDGKIDWLMPAEAIALLVRAYTPWPGTWTEVDGKRLKILAVQAIQADEMFDPGHRFVFLEGNPCIACGEGSALELLRVQPEGGKPMSGQEYLRGVKSWEGSIEKGVRSGV